MTFSLRLQEPGLYYKLAFIMTHICSFFFFFTCRDHNQYINDQSNIHVRTHIIDGTYSCICVSIYRLTDHIYVDIL